MKSRQRSAFTLVELLVVISIIALLLSILMPSLNKARERARRVICASNLKQASTGCMMYMGDYKYYPHDRTIGGNGYYNYFLAYNGSSCSPVTAPAKFNDLANNVNWTNTGLLYWYKYLGNPKMWFCPTEKSIMFLHKTYFDNDKLKPEEVRINILKPDPSAAANLTAVHTSYAMRNYDPRFLVETRGSFTAASKTEAVKLRPGGKYALLVDRWQYGAATNVHEGRFYNIAYSDGHAGTYTDQKKIVASTYSSPTRITEVIPWQFFDKGF